MAEVFHVPRVKICGLSRAEEVEAAVESGAEAIGFVHHPPSPRSLGAHAAAELSRLLPQGVLPVAVMVDPRADEALSWAERAGARAVQLCGEERAEDWFDFPLPVLKRIAVAEDSTDALVEWASVALFRQPV